MKIKIYQIDAFADYRLAFESEELIKKLNPDFKLIGTAKLFLSGIITID